MTNKNEKICESFSQIMWHDSKLLGLHLVKDPDKGRYDLQLDLNLIVYSEGKIEWKRQSALFSNCRIVLADLDLLGILLCSGDIGAATCHVDPVAFEKRKRDKAQLFDLPQSGNPLDECIGFFFEMIPPGGQLIVFARDFELI